MNILNLLYFHKKRFIIGICFTGAYFYLAKKAIINKYEPVRLGVAGSLAHVLCECFFHIIDTINIRSKVS
jgi:hypothetical protein